jgi:hypothetical protein
MEVRALSLSACSGTAGAEGGAGGRRAGIWLRSVSRRAGAGGRLGGHACDCYGWLAAGLAVAGGRTCLMRRRSAESMKKYLSSSRRKDWVATVQIDEKQTRKLPRSVNGTAAAPACLQSEDQLSRAATLAQNHLDCRAAPSLSAARAAICAIARITPATARVPTIIEEERVEAANELVHGLQAQQRRAAVCGRVQCTAARSAVTVQRTPIACRLGSGRPQLRPRAGATAAQGTCHPPTLV